MADAEDFEQLWRDAFDAYEKETDRKLDHDGSLRKLRSVNDLLEQIESEGRVFIDWRNKHRKLWSSLTTFLTPITTISSVAKDALANTPYAPVSVVLGGVLYLVKVRH
jgi:hypothetical protein